MSRSKIPTLSADIKQQLTTERALYIQSLRGSDGRDGIDGQDGKQGPRGLQGPAGINGVNGQQGPKGDKGEKGKDGRDGKDGQDGKDGRGIQRMYITRGDLYVVYTDGEEKNLGKVEGPMGPAGARSFWSGGDSPLKIITTSTSETLDIGHNTYIRQTASGITTVLNASKEGSKIYIKNVSGGTNYVNNLIDGLSDSFVLSDDRCYTLVYLGGGSFEIL